MVHVLGVALV